MNTPGISPSPEDTERRKRVAGGCLSATLGATGTPLLVAGLVLLKQCSGRGPLVHEGSYTPAAWTFGKVAAWILTPMGALLLVASLVFAIIAIRTKRQTI
ncbi:MAG: hypothetical protein IPK60_15740 [Sandaracinaceae bacterium]|jgi:hypothetical protein|nr:hypothetical protein [Sandaracinaceae bacterium]